PTSYPAKGKSVIRYSRNISIVSCPAAILFFLLIQLFIENIIPMPNLYRLNTWIADAPISLRQPNGQVWSPQNDDRRYSESGKVML
ncbi:hypothetical protein MJN76_29045, partial [Salmonella enterica subsp. enterica serovar Anatum]|nr:hypothetical protein [Salmonella enterica subsp. enterica serovar Anatum]